MTDTSSSYVSCAKHRCLITVTGPPPDAVANFGTVNGDITLSITAIRENEVTVKAGGSEATIQEESMADVAGLRVTALSARGESVVLEVVPA
ncbi:MAG: hypothetical protein ACRDYA_14435 [Egibacteraceae bacterium]